MKQTIEYNLKDKTAELEEVTLIEGVLTIKFKDKKPQAPKHPTVPTDELIAGWHGPKGYRLQTHESRKVICCCCGAEIPAGEQHARWTLPGNPLTFHPGKPQDDPNARAAHPGCLWLASHPGHFGYPLPSGFRAPEGLIHPPTEPKAEILGANYATELPDPEFVPSVECLPDLRPVHVRGNGVEFLLFTEVIRKNPSPHAKVGAYKHTHCTDMPWREFVRGTESCKRASRAIQEEVARLGYSAGTFQPQSWRREYLKRVLESL